VLRQVTAVSGSQELPLSFPAIEAARLPSAGPRQARPTTTERPEMTSSRNHLLGFGWSGSDLLPGLTLLLVLACTSISRAQGFGPDPFRPYNSQYDPFVFPVAPGPLDVGGNPFLGRNGLRGANQFQNYLNELNADVRTGIGAPYYRANRIYDKEFNRVYRPNEKADRSFEASQGAITDAYFKYLRESDPKKRAELFREYNQAQNRSARELASPRSAPPPNSPAPRRDARPGTSGSTRGRSTGLPSPPPPLSIESGISRGVPSRSRSTNSPDSLRIGPAPPPLGPSGDSSGSSLDRSPSDVLNRALRMERKRFGSRPRSTAPLSPGTP
jgi:hypothetical protein